jgi:hypothetical protein
MKKNWIIAVALLVYTLIIFLPPILHGYIYPNNSDDSAYHLWFIDALRNGTAGNGAYWGNYVIGYPLIWLNSLFGFSIDVMFLWLNYILLWSVGISIYLLVSKITNCKMGLMAIPVVMFCTPSTLGLFDAGTIFDLATVGVILPLMLLCIILGLNKKIWFIPTAILFIALITIHSIGIIPYIGDNLVEPSPSLFQFIVVLFGRISTILILLPISYLVFKWKSVGLNKTQKIALLLMVIVIMALVIASFSNITAFPLRFSIDLAIVLAIASSCLLAITVKTVKENMVLALVLTIIVIGSSGVFSTYLNYNSAVKKIDMQVISYVNSLDGKYYSCSPEVAPWIYGRFINKEYKDGELPYIERNIPMTSKTSPNTRYYWGDNVTRMSNSFTVYTFKEGDIVINVIP